MRGLLVLLFAIGVVFQGFAQDTIKTKTPSQAPVAATVGLRTFWMSTNYWEDFKNDYALGQGAYVQLATKRFKGFSAKARFGAYGRVLSSDLLAPDPRTGAGNRYEVGLFDIANPESRAYGKVEELQISYQSKKLSATIGKMSVNTPFINPQDGRLGPTFAEGLKVGFRPNPKHQFSWDLITRISPRSTSGWFGVGESMGLYPMGLGESGKPGAYFGVTKSNFINSLDWKWKLDSSTELNLNHTLVQNISSTVFSQFTKDWSVDGTQSKIISGLQVIVQQGLGNGGNDDPAKRYKNPDDINYILGGRLGWKDRQTQVVLAYTNISGDGRFLSPREWGREPFFTFIPRERTEGYGYAQSITGLIQRSYGENQGQVYVHGGFVRLPDPADFEVNKYAFPSYAQVNLGWKYAPKDFLKGLDIHALVMGKFNMKSGEMKPQWIYNKVNMIHVNVILNYTIHWEMFN
jgi:hypothetical protein